MKTKCRKLLKKPRNESLSIKGPKPNSNRSSLIRSGDSSKESQKKGKKETCITM